MKRFGLKMIHDYLGGRTVEWTQWFKRLRDREESLRSVQKKANTEYPLVHHAERVER